MRAIGLMSGTSLDGIDAALVDLHPQGESYAWTIERFVTVPFDVGLRDRLRAALPPKIANAAQIAALDRELGDAFAAAAVTIAGGERVDFVASHGLTLYHCGEASQTMQIGDPYRIRDAVGASVVFDFRRADCAVGGQGAPLVPHVDAMLLARVDCDVVALNIGGIANVTVLARGGRVADALAWDTGPGNMLIDTIVARRTNDRERFDCDGARAARGTIDEGIVQELVARDAFYFVQPPPKSTGRERFGAQLLDTHAALFADLPLDDACATLAAFTVETIAADLDRYGPARGSLVVSGGGARNHTLVAWLAARLPQFDVVVSDVRGIDADAKEALAFIVLGYESLRERPANVPRATGAARPTVLGAIVPHGLAGLLAQIAAEVVANER